MDDNKDEGHRMFDKIFSGFFGSGFDEHFREMTRQMDEMFKQFGDSTISIEFHPPSMSGNLPPPGNNDPRDQMLKEPENVSGQKAPSNSPGDVAGESTLSPPGDVAGESTLSPPWHTTWSPRVFPSFFGSLPGFRPPFEDREIGNQSPDCECGERDASSWQPVSSTTRSSWNNTFSSFSNDGSGWSGETVQTVRHPDGSVEKIVKKTENGRTCTTVTTTDPNGHSTSTTTCDRPAIDGSPSITDKPSADSKMSKLWPWSSPTKPKSPTASGYSPDDASFFKKNFGFDIFKPKDS